MFARALLLAVMFALVAGVVPARAEAAWTTLGSGRGGVFLACKTPENGGYGPVWKVTLVLATAQGGPQAAARFTVRRPQAGGWFSTVATVNMAAGGRCVGRARCLRVPARRVLGWRLAPRPVRVQPELLPADGRHGLGAAS